MKRFIFFILFAFAVFNLAAQSKILSATDISYRGDNNDAISDLRTGLAGYKAGAISIEKVDLGQRTGQEFFIEIKGNTTQLKYTTATSLENAIYTYLDMLGFRWYGPGENWVIKPATITRKDVTGRWVSPSFRNRQFFGTGGLDAFPAFDPNNTYKQQWYAWKRRNRFNADFQSVGHTGQAFYLENKATLDANPDWFSTETGKANGRLRIDKSAAVKAYIQWIKKTYGRSQATFQAIGVDPEDGRGGPDDPLPAGMKGISNVADKWWWLANEVAKEYPENDNRIVITAYAYGNGPENALTPSFSLRKNVYPVIIPYAFQTAYLPAQMIKVWASRISGKMGIYDYWNITQWSSGLPQFNIYSMKEKLLFWQQNKIDGIYLETTDAAGPMGHALWLAGQLQWNTGQDFTTLYTQYLNDCFGKAATAMKAMYDRWSTNYQGSGDVSLSLADLKKASSLVPRGSPEWKRINELKAYVHYMKMYYAHDNTQQSKDELYRYLYRIHHLMMVQTSAFIGQGYIAPLDKGNIVPSSGSTRPLTENEIEKQFEKDLQTDAPRYTLVPFQFNYQNVGYLQPIDKNAWRYGGFFCDFFFLAPFSGSLEFDAGAVGKSPFKFFSDNSILIQDTIGLPRSDYQEPINDRTWNMKRFKVTIKKGEVYHFQTQYGYSRITIKTPGIVLLKRPGEQDFDNYAYPIQYIYVPKNATEIIFFDTEPEGRNGRGYFVAPDGKPVKRENIGVKDIYRVSVEPRYRGMVWKADFGHPSWSLKNIPNIASLQLFSYTE